MKTLNEISKRLLIVVLALLFTTTMFAQSENGNVVTIKGKVVDTETQKPINYVNIYIDNSNIGIVSNSEGGFILKVPESLKNNALVFSCLGFKSKKMKLSELSSNETVLIRLTPESINLQELIIRTDDPIALIKAAVKNVPDNYGTKPYICYAFYRELIMQNRKYAGIAEAVLNIYKSPYTPYGSDRLKVYKGRKSEDVQKMDTVLFKLKGGHYIAMMLDLAKNPASFMEEQYIVWYSYKPVKTLSIDGRETYVIEFAQNSSVQEPLYDGKIYLDVQTLAIVKSEFAFSPSGLEHANKLLVDRKPLGVKVQTLAGNYMVDYRYNNGKWVLNHIHYDVKFKVDKKKQFFSKTYTSIVDLAITDRDTVNVTKYKISESIKPTEIFIDNVSRYYDEKFWGDFNIIRPEESVEDAVERINKKMNK